MRPRLLALCTGVCLLAAACGSSGNGTGAPSTSGAPTTTVPAARPLVIDTDLAADDLVAILYLLASPSVDVKAITVSGTGEVHCPAGATIASSLATLAGRGSLPVACGRASPLAGAHAFPDAWRALADDAYGLALPQGQPSSSTKAVDLIGDVVGASPTPVTVLTLGPLTNLAEALQADASLAGKIAGVYVMGGALDVAGNVGSEGGIDNVGAEWNVYVDPTAAAVVLAAGPPVTLVPLDATNKAPVTSDFRAAVAANAHTKPAQIAQQLLGGASYMWDTLAALMLVDERVATTWTNERLAVVEAEGRESGRLVRAADGHEIRVALEPDMARARDALLRALDGLQPDQPVLEPQPLASLAVHFDGAACTWDGPPALPAGLVQMTYDPKVQGASALVFVRLKQGATYDELLAYLAAHPGIEQPPPMTDLLEVIESKSMVTLQPGTWFAACLDMTRNLPVLVGQTITVG